MAITEIVTTLTISALICGLNAWYAATVKFATNETKAIHGIKRIFLTIISWLVIFYLIGASYNDIASPEPLTKAVLAGLLVRVFAISLIMSVLYINKLTGIMVDILTEANACQKESLSVVKSLASQIKNNKPD